MSENTQNQIQCLNYGACKLQNEVQDREISDLKSEVNKLKDDVQNIKLQQIKDAEKVNALYASVDEIKVAIKEMTISMKDMNKSLNDKMDVGFKEVNLKMDNKIENLTKPWKSMLFEALKLIIFATIGMLIAYSAGKGMKIL